MGTLYSRSIGALKSKGKYRDSFVKSTEEGAKFLKSLPFIKKINNIVIIIIILMLWISIIIKINTIQFR